MADSVEDASETWPKRWVRLKKHRKATIRTWQNGVARKATERPNSASQYNPEIFGTDEAVREIEMACIEGGVPISKTAHLRKFWMRDPKDRIVGVCSGEETQFVFAQWSSSGEIHGRPISPTALRAMGVQLQ